MISTTPRTLTAPVTSFVFDSEEANIRAPNTHTTVAGIMPPGMSLEGDADADDALGLDALAALPPAVLPPEEALGKGFMPGLAAFTGVMVAEDIPAFAC